MTGALHVIGTRAMLRSLRPRGAPARTATRLLERLYLAPGRVISMSELIDSAYGDEIDGGAEGARVVVTQTLARLRRSGIPIETVRNRRGFRVPPRAP
jgi:DNA-binding response OmpR family regulator